MPRISQNRTRQPRRAGFSLIELLIVIAVMGVLVGLAMPSSNPSTADQLRSTAQILATDLHFGRSLAVTNNSSYEFVFDVDANSYVMRHSGVNADLDDLPELPFRNIDDPGDEHIVDLDELPHFGTTVSIAAVAGYDSFLEETDTIEFGPLGETTRSGSTLIWLEAGQGDETRYVQLTVNPITGLVEIGEISSSGPPNWLLAK